jgi:hypothetical protein
VLSKTRYSEQVTRACTHQTLCHFSYRRVAEKTEAKMHLAASLCECCSSRVSEVMAAQANVYPALQLPGLLGTTGQLAFASSVRAKVYSRLGQLLSRTENSSHPVDVAIFQTCQLLFSIQQARFWIDLKNVALDKAWMCQQVEIAIRGRQHTDRTKESSPVHYICSKHPDTGEAKVAAAREVVATAISADRAVKAELGGAVEEDLKLCAGVGTQEARHEAYRGDQADDGIILPAPVFEFDFDFGTCAKTR